MTVIYKKMTQTQMIVVGYGFYFFRTMLPGREDGFFHGKNGERLAEKET